MRSDMAEFLPETFTTEDETRLDTDSSWFSTELCVIYSLTFWKLKITKLVMATPSVKSRTSLRILYWPSIYLISMPPYIKIMKVLEPKSEEDFRKYYDL